MTGNRRLCSGQAELQESHVIPAFVYRWRRDTAPTPHMRASDAPNLRVQDGLKYFWLCKDCEQRLSDWERQFSNKIFYPVTDDSKGRLNYGDWLLKFCVSISWRILLLAKERDSLVKLPREHQAEATEALETWGKFLRGELPTPGRFEQHLLVCENIDWIRDLASLPANINRYAMRSIEMDIGSTDNLGFTFVKMGPTAVIGFYCITDPHEWSGGKVHVRRGTVNSMTYKLPPVFIEYLLGRARRYGAVMSGLSERQRGKADKATTEGILKNKDKLRQSHWMRAMQRDLSLFGASALGIGFPDKNDSSE